MKNNTLPEEKLLRLIRGEKKAQVKNTSRLYSSRRYPSFISLEGITMVCLFLSFAYLAASFIYPWVGLAKIKLPVKPQQKEMTLAVLSEETKPFELYARQMSQHQLFGNSVKNEAAVSLIATADILKELALVGIISGVNPQAIIEDKKAGKIYYVTKSQSVGEYRVEDIQEGKIILNYNGQKYELYI